MKKTTIEWHNVETDGLPKESGFYLTLASNSFKDIDTLPYSARHKAFNVTDYESANDVPFWSYDVIYWWAEIPNIDMGDDEL